MHVDPITSAFTISSQVTFTRPDTNDRGGPAHHCAGRSELPWARRVRPRSRPPVPRLRSVRIRACGLDRSRTLRGWTLLLPHCTHAPPRAGHPGRTESGFATHRPDPGSG